MKTGSGMSIVVCGLSITSSWGNGHAVTYRGLVRELAKSGHDVLFLERDVPWYAANRDLPEPPGCRLGLYAGLDELRRTWGRAMAEADLVVVGSYVPEGVKVSRLALEAAKGLVAFYDIDTPVTLAALERGDCEYLAPELIPAFDLYLSFTGGPTLKTLEERWGARLARALYCSADPEAYYPEPREPRWDLGYLGTYSPDRQPSLERLLCEPARSWPQGRFVVAGPQYPAGLDWPANVERTDHLAPSLHRDFYCSQRFTLNITRADMAKAGWSPSIRLFEAAACGAPIISDWWEGLDQFFTPYEEIFIAANARDALLVLRDLAEGERRHVAEAARERVLTDHTAARRARDLEACAEEAAALKGVARPRVQGGLERRHERSARDEQGRGDRRPGPMVP